ncbi:MAG TPA: sugar transferase [Bacteroidales bacterium]|nr:sugar transferase [Bacteroidales bacterium]
MEIRKYRIITVLADILILALSFLVIVWYKPASLHSVLPSHTTFFLGLAVMWIIVSLVNGKMHKGKIVNYSSLFSRVMTSNIIAVSITALVMYSFREYQFSRTVVLGTAALTTIFELITGSIYIAYKKAKLQDYEEYDKYSAPRKLSEYELVNGTNGKKDHANINISVHPSIARAIEEECGKDMAKKILGMTSRTLDENTVVLSTTTVFNILGLSHPSYDCIINLRRINDIKKLDDFLDAVNSKLNPKGYFLCCVETKDQRKKRILKKFPPVINYFFYSIDFIIKRIFPKFKLTRGLYYLLTRGENAVVSRAEALGRLSRSGFKIRQETFINNLLCIEAIKAGAPIIKNGINHGPLIALPRVGKGGKIIKVYKLRTMHPYSEYIQDYVYKLHDLQDGGKFKNDFRITSWGALSRKIWLDELPMVINFLKGDMKLFGVRPLSKQYFELYRPEVRERRIKYKPGLIPPYYADMPGDLDAIQASEIRYLDAYDRHPILTDISYLFRSIWNIVFRRARSN